MKKVQQDIMCALLKMLLEQERIPQEIYEKSRERILDTWDWPEIFHDAEAAEKEGSHGYPQNPC